MVVGELYIPLSVPYSKALSYDLAKDPALIDFSVLASNDELGVINFITSNTVSLFS